MERIGDFLANRYTVAYGVAILLHLLLFLFHATIKEAFVGLDSLPPPPTQSKPLQFEFVEVPNQEKAPRPPEKTPLAADRNSRAQDQADRALPESHLPYNAGLADTRDLRETVPGQRGDEGAQGRSEQAKDKIEQSEDAESRNQEQAEQTTDFSARLRESKRENERLRQEALYGRPSVPPSLQMNNVQSRALEQGGLQLSTYDWDFAPYLSYLKRHIGSHVYPPSAFSDLGLIEGQTIVRFKIMRDGTLKDLEVMGYKGSALLRDTSHKAVVLSADFRPLPESFPEPYLEVTGRFDYTVIRNFR